MAEEPHGTARHTNRLIHETSPYLLQHAHNPVDWYAWGEDALRRAREEDKPILLSSGYSACHWCHVMERESVENEATARLMNESFVNIKVDREERPDLDTIYMSAVQMMTGSGGWPMTVFLTPDQVPFYGGTYFPPQDRHGLPGFPRVLASIAQAYRERRADIVGDAGSLVAELGKHDELPPAGGALAPELLDTAAANLMRNHDPRFGGFGGAPKFPPSMTLSFLLRRSRAARGPEAELYLKAVETTLEKMAQGGIYDQLGGGFHRYSVDAYWLVPHFEKMLYDNALLSRLYVDAHLATGNPLYRRVAEETLDYVLREMTSPEGGFYSAQDADSEGEEGKFFVWTPAEVVSVVGERDAEIFCAYYDVSAEGNFEGHNILHVPRPARDVARLLGIGEPDLLAALERSRRLLHGVREGRVKPGRDEKILTAWNGLMLRSFAEAGNALDREDYRAAAVRNAEFIFSALERDGRLLRTYRDGEAKLAGYLEDYAFLLDGLLSLYEAVFDPRWIEQALRLAGVLVDKFWDEAQGGFFFTASDHEQLIRRPKDVYDNATPSGNSAAAYALLRLWKLTADERWLRYATPLFERLAAPMARHPNAFGHLLCALDFHLSRAKEIAVVGPPDAPATRALLRELFGRYLPNKVVAAGTGTELELLRNRSNPAGAPTAYVCENYTCSRPVTTPGELAALLDSLG
jgi:uncharacterized protein YyaL (SSP411 family)